MNQKKKHILALLLSVMLLVSPLLSLWVGAEADVSRNPIPGSASSATTPSEQLPPVIISGNRKSFSTMSANVKEYAETNDDVKGWLYIPNTNIDTPINLDGDDNAYYNKRDWKEKNYPSNSHANYVTTSTYLDYRTTIGSTWKSGSRNYVIYGHNWSNLRNPMDIGNNANHRMFGQLPSYTNIDFLRQNPYIYFSTGKNEGVWKIFSVAYIETSPTVEFNYNSPNPSNESFARVLSEFKARSLFDTGVEVSTSDRILTLSTCSRRYANVGDNQRFVVVARLLRGDETGTDPVEVTVSQNPKLPVFNK